MSSGSAVQRPPTTNQGRTTKLVSPLFKKLAKDGRLSLKDANKLGARYQVAGTIDARESLDMKRDSQVVLGRSVNVRVSKVALAALKDAFEGPVLL